MTSTKIIVLAAALVASIGTARASEPAPRLTMKPLHGVSFDVGSERAVSYFTSENGTCKLFVTMAGQPNWDSPTDFVSTRFETGVRSGTTGRYISNQGNAFEFSCTTDALAMTIKPLDQVAGIASH